MDMRYLNGPWDNNACRGYAIMAMRAAGVPEESIRETIGAMTETFDMYSVEEAATYYNGTAL